jgi:hypothetical protein
MLRIVNVVRREEGLMRSAGLFVAATLATVIGCGGDYNLASDSRGTAPLPASVKCQDAAQLRDRATRDRRSSSERSSDQEKIDLASRARFVATLAIIADLRCKVPLAETDEILRRALDAAREAEDTGGFYARTLKWQEASLIADEAVDLMISQIPDPTSK